MSVGEQQAWDCLRSMKDPTTHTDIVSLGIAKAVQVDNDTVTVHLAPPEGDPYQHEALAAAIRRELSAIDGIENVVVKWPKSSAVVSNGSSSINEDGNNGSSEQSPLHLPILEDTSNPEMDAMNASLGRLGVAPEAGYGAGGPEEPPSPVSDLDHNRYEEWPPVFQWEIDPGDPTLISGEEHVQMGDWEYDIWWQSHPVGLIYASIQAMDEDNKTGGPERQHPVGRNVVVNLVFDRKRDGIIAIYGSATDFRPFVEAFRVGCKLEEQTKESKA